MPHRSRISVLPLTDIVTLATASAARAASRGTARYGALDTATSTFVVGNPLATQPLA